MAIVLMIGGAVCAAPPIAHAITGAVSAARAKTIWAEWKRAFARHPRESLAANPGEPALWLRVTRGKLSMLALAESDSDALHRFPAVRRVAENNALVISAHRDTHFRSLQRVQVGDAMTIEWANGQIDHYEVRKIRVLLPEQVAAAAADPECRGALHLLTCYPFHFFGAAPKRYLVTALPVD
jgi:LPXTG-site transpeptidase (sortase) family protein